jgi:hypothetical protein
MTSDRGFTKGGPAPRLTSKELAALIVDALLRADIVSEHRVPTAMAVVAEELEARKRVGDY